jgi:hypothetical protein
MRKALATILLAASFCVASAAQAFTLDWTALIPEWDRSDTSGSQIFIDVDGSGIDITVSYSANMWDNNSVPELYDSVLSPTDEILGTLRYTNDRTPEFTETVITIAFSESVIIQEMGTVSLSIIQGRQENAVVQAFDSSGAGVLATTYGTTTPTLVALDIDGDSAYRSRGLGAQEHDLYGNTFYSYTDQGIREVRFSQYSTEIGGDEIVLAFGSQGITNVSFQAVPEPSSAILISLGLVLLGNRRAKRRSHAGTATRGLAA